MPNEVKLSSNNLKPKLPMKPQELPDYWDDVSRTFIGDAPQSLWRAHSDRVNISLLADWLGERQYTDILKTDLFDEAVSQGLYPFLREHAHVVHGIDVAAESVNSAKKRFPGLKAICADVRELPFKNHQFDLIVSNSTLDHFQSSGEIDMALREMFRVLKPGGELLISLDNMQNPIIGLRNVLPFRLLKALHLVPYFVGKSYGRRGLTSALENTGFEVLKSQAIMHCPRVLAVAVAGMLQKKISIKSRQRFLGLLAKFEWAAKLPTRFFTGHFVAVLAVKPTSQGKMNSLEGTAPENQADELIVPAGN
jgi:SAM-dependent methyltransferase